MLCVHSYLILMNVSTYEHLRRSRVPYLRDYPDHLNPFYQSLCTHLRDTFCHAGLLVDWKKVELLGIVTRLE